VFSRRSITREPSAESRRKSAGHEITFFEKAVTNHAIASPKVGNRNCRRPFAFPSEAQRTVGFSRRCFTSRLPHEDRFRYSLVLSSSTPLSTFSYFVVFGFADRFWYSQISTSFISRIHRVFGYSLRFRLFFFFFFTRISIIYSYLCLY